MEGANSKRLKAEKKTKKNKPVLLIPSLASLSFPSFLSTLLQANKAQRSNNLDQRHSLEVMVLLRQRAKSSCIYNQQAEDQNTGRQMSHGTGPATIDSAPTYTGLPGFTEPSTVHEQNSTDITVVKKKWKVVLKITLT